jgi:hypothetical protein
MVHNQQNGGVEVGGVLSLFPPGQRQRERDNS